MPAPDSYPHVTCGRAVKGQGPQAWRRHRRAATSATMGIFLTPDPESPLYCARRDLWPGNPAGKPPVARRRGTQPCGRALRWRCGPGCGCGGFRTLLPIVAQPPGDLARALGSHLDHGPAHVRRTGAGHMERDRGRVRPPGQLPVKPRTRAGDDPDRLGPGGGRVAVTAPSTAQGTAR